MLSSAKKIQDCPRAKDLSGHASLLGQKFNCSPFSIEMSIYQHLELRLHLIYGELRSR